MSPPLLELDAAGRRFGAVIALQPISLCIAGDSAPIVAVAGESGSGKTTLASLLLGFLPPSMGAIRYRGTDLDRLPRSGRRRFRKEVQAVFQDPFAVYNPFYRVDHALIEPLRLFGLARSWRDARDMMEQACQRVGLHPADTLGRFPHQLSGGQRQRLMVARALLLEPKLLIADEPVSMIDASLRALVLGSLRTLNSELAIPILYITHDLTTAYHIADTIIVLYRGAVVEAGDAATVIQQPQHPYTRLLIELDSVARSRRALGSSAAGGEGRCGPAGGGDRWRMHLRGALPPRDDKMPRAPAGTVRDHEPAGRALLSARTVAAIRRSWPQRPSSPSHPGE